MTTTGSLPTPAPLTIDKRSNLSQQELLNEYVKPGRPVVLTDVARRWGIDEALAGIEELRERDAAAADDSSTASSFVSDGEATTPAARHGEPPQSPSA